MKIMKEKNNPSKPPQSSTPNPQFTEGVHFYFDDGLMVLTELYLAERGYCCKNGCRHCPYGFKKKEE
jgi:Family of unknown function (DUF5522)